MAGTTTKTSTHRCPDLEVKASVPNKETVAAMLEADQIAKDPSVKGYADLDALFADLKQ